MAGDRVLCDANVVVDWMLSLAGHASHVDPARQRPTALGRLLEVCCVIVGSAKIQDEVFATLKRRGYPVPTSVVLTMQRRYEKFLFVKPSQVNATAQPPRSTPANDVHIVRAAVATSASWLLTADSGWDETVHRWLRTHGIDCKDPHWVDANVPPSATPCP